MSSARAWEVAVAALAAGYFALGIGLNLEWADEGQMVYPSWLVAEGALPHGDFHHIYGPSLFWLNGALLRVFGPDLLVLRAWMVVIKTAVAVLGFAAARRASSTPVALAVTLLLVAVWGTPWPAFSTPYASYDALALGLAGVLLLRARGEGAVLRCACAGLCFGAAATFKQTTGFFFYLAALVELASLSSGPLRLAAFVAAGAAAAAVLLHGADPVSALAIGAPLGLALVVLGRREGGESAARQVFALSAGAALPLAACAALYAARGELSSLLANTVTDLPPAIRLSHPVELPRLVALLWCALGAGALLAVGGHGVAWRRAGLAAAIACGIALVAAAVRGDATWGWQAGVMGLLSLLPFVATWSAAGALFATAPGFGRLAYLVAATGLFYLHPTAAFWHAVAALPLFVPALAAGVQRAVGTGAGPAAGALAVALAALVALPFARVLVEQRREAVHVLEGVERAGNLRLDARRRAQARVVEHLLAPRQRERPVLVLGGHTLVYFLAERRSPVELYEFDLYLLGFGLLENAEARRRIDQRALIERLRTLRPLVVESLEDDRPARLRRALPALGRHLDTHYRRAARFGEFRVLAPAKE